MTVEGLAPAKINLALHVTGRRDDGYHLLDSLVVFAEQSDRLTATAAGHLSLTVSGAFADGVPADAGNLVLKAAQLLARKRGVTVGAKISLEKNLPHGAGIGGGSSDAATALRLLADLWQVAGLSDVEALPLGADVPVCLLAPKACFMRGIGDIVALAPDLPEFYLVLVNPGISIATGAVFQFFDEHHGCDNSGLDPLPDNPDAAQFETWLRRQRNDLTGVSGSATFAPVIRDVLNELMGSPGCGHAQMSGSGSTCWGYYQDKYAAEIARDHIAGTHPGWWVETTRISG